MADLDKEVISTTGDLADNIATMFTNGSSGFFIFIFVLMVAIITFSLFMFLAYLIKRGNKSY